MHEFTCRLGVPIQVHSDQGRNFEPALFSEMTKLLGIQKTRTTAVHPQSDGMIERFNKTVGNMPSYTSRKKTEELGKVGKVQATNKSRNTITALNFENVCTTL